MLADQPNLKKRNIVHLKMLSFLGAAICVVPIAMEPGLDLPFWLPLICVGVCAFLPSLLNRPQWLGFLISSATGNLTGWCIGLIIWWPRDPIAGSFVPLITIVWTVIGTFVALVGAYSGSRLTLPNEKLRRIAWLAMTGLIAFGPVRLAVTPALVGRRIARNNDVAAKRFTSLQRTVGRTFVTSSDPAQICEGSRLAENYSGPPFSHTDWQRITGNYVKQDGYFFMVYCQEKSGYLIDSQPARPGNDGTRHFCADETGEIGCSMEWNRSRHVCIACQEVKTERHRP